MATFRVVVVLALLGICTVSGHGEQGNILEKLWETYQASLKDDKPDMPEKPDYDPRVADMDFLVGNINLNRLCSNYECHARMTEAIVALNVKVMRELSEKYPFEDYYYSYHPIHLRSVEMHILVITVFHRMVPGGNMTTTQPPTGMTSRPTTRRPSTTSVQTVSTTTVQTVSTSTTQRPATTTTVAGTTTTDPDGFRSSYTCSFESVNDTLCGAVHDDNADFDWAQHQGPTFSQGTGPSEAFNGNYFLYTESSKPRATGDTARFITPAFAAGDYCVRFYYFMVGQHTGSLTVYILKPSEEVQVWHRSGDTEIFNWFSASAPATLENGDRIAFHAITLDDYQGDTSIDLVRIDMDASDCPLLDTTN